MTEGKSDFLRFLEGLDMGHLAPVFRAEDIDMSVLPLLETNDLVQLGLTIGQRKKLRAALDRLKRPVAAPEARQPDAGDNQIYLRRLSVMFCDMVGSTDLGERLGIEQMQNLLAHYYDVARRVAADHGGHIATVQGDGVIMLFGFPKAIDGTAAHCVQAAAALQRALAAEPAQLFGEAPIHIRTRIGIATGKAAVAEADGSVPGGAMHLVGPVVNRAARLQTFAEDLSIVVDQHTRDQTDRHFEYSEPKAAYLKGLHQEVAVSQVLGLRTRPQGESGGTFRLIGRKRSLDRLGAMWRRTEPGQGSVVTITGDAGIGKTALVREFLARLPPGTHRVVWLEGSPLAEQYALWPVISFLDNAKAGGAGPDSSSAVAGETARDLLARIDRADPGISGAAAALLRLDVQKHGGGPATAGQRNAVLDLMAGWMTETGGVSTVLVLENAQWMDHTTRDLMEACTGARDGRAPSNILVIALSRDPFEDILGTGPDATRIDLDVLEPEASEDLLNQVVRGHPLPTSVRDNILRHSGGNPLMIETLGRSHEVWHAADLVGEVDVPFAIYETVTRRLNEITSGKHTIEAMSVLNAPANARLLAQVMQRPDANLSVALTALERAGLAVRDGGAETGNFRIRHQVYRDVIYEQITGQARQKLHAAAYSALRAGDTGIASARPDILALHAAAAQKNDSAAIHALEAGDKALHLSALIEASYFFHLAEASLMRRPDDPETDRKRLRAATGLASVERSRFGIATDKSGELGKEIARLAHRLGDSRSELLALNGLYAHALVRADYPLAKDRANALLAAALRNGDATFEMIGTRAVGGVALHRGDLDTALDRLETALTAYDRDTHLPLAHAHGYDHAEICGAFLSFTHWLRGDPAAARRVSDFSIRHSRAIDHAHSLGQAMAFRVMLGALARDDETLCSIGAEGVDLADKFDLRVMRAAAFLFPYATRLCVRTAAPTGDDLSELQDRVTAFKKHNPYNYGPLTATIQAEVALRAERLDLVESALETGREIEQRTGETWTSPELSRLTAQFLQAAGDPDRARDVRKAAFEKAMQAGSVMFAVRIASDMAEAESQPPVGCLDAALARVQSDDGGWDLRRAQSLKQNQRSA